MNTALLIEGWITVNRAAEMLGCTTGRIRQLLGDGTITGKKLDGSFVWLVDEKSVEKYGKLEFPSARPRIGRG